MTLNTFHQIGSWPLVISRAMNAYGIEGAGLLKRIGIEPVSAAKPDTRYSLETVHRLWRLAESLSRDEAVGLSVASYVRPTSWHALGFAIWASDTLLEGFNRLADNFRMFANYGVLSVIERAGQVEIQVHRDERITQWCSAETDAFIGTCVLTARHIYQPGFAPLQVWLSRPQPVDPTPWQRLFKCPVYFNAAFERIIFPADIMQQPLLTASPDLAAQNDALVADYVARLDNHDLPARLESLLLNHLPLGSLPVTQAAGLLKMSQRTLQRRLTDKGVSFGQILDGLRQKQALNWVQRGDLPFGEISYRLGFTEAGNFSRAFKRWYQQTPGQMRQRAKLN